jgi:Peptidase inhibitor family I36
MSRVRSLNHRGGLVGALVVLVLGLVGVMPTGVASADQYAAPNLAESRRPTGPLAAEMKELLKLQPGGVQVSDNALVWDSGNTVVVFPSPGEGVAPKGLGANVRPDVLRSIGAQWMISPDGIEDVHGCPSGVLTKDYYCFYTDRDFGGRRLQFSETCSDFAADWGFNNQTSSWVNTGTNKEIEGWDSQNRYHLWDEPQHSVSSFVGSSNNDRMSWWSCTHQ